MLRRQDRLLALLAQTMGNTEQALAHFGDSLVASNYGAIPIVNSPLAGSISFLLKSSKTVTALLWKCFRFGEMLF